LVKQHVEEAGLKPLCALGPLRRCQLHLLLLCLLHWLLLLLLLFPARVVCRLCLLRELFVARPHLLRYLLPHGLPEVLVELCQGGLEGLR